jgi:hypothetical protein
MTILIHKTDDVAAITTPEVAAAAKAIALHDGWTEQDWDTVADRHKQRYYRLAQVALNAAQPALLDRVRGQQARLDAVDRLSQGFVEKPINALDSIEQPGFGRGVRAAGREIRAVLDAPEEP